MWGDELVDGVNVCNFVRTKWLIKWQAGINIGWKVSLMMLVWM